MNNIYYLIIKEKRTETILHFEQNAFDAKRLLFFFSTTFCELKLGHCHSHNLITSVSMKQLTIFFMLFTFSSGFRPFFSILLLD